ncbi:RNA-binding domain-containing protein [Gigaspora margarita]|uniref:Nucleolar protein 12 n=1 Tax=Gigaspora margarita TaxID=4874 RepID=A0A8H4A0S6_GIGMA|nr:RNA-binding domain-containing protein [Gigaspora margarita]
MSEYVPGSLAQSLLGKQVSPIDSEIDILFQNNIGQAKSTIKLKEKTVTNTKNHSKSHTIVEEDSEISRKRKKKKTLKHVSQDDGTQLDSSKSKKEGEFKKKSIEELYEMKLVKGKDKESENSLLSKIKRKTSHDQPEETYLFHETNFKHKRLEEKSKLLKNKKKPDDDELDDMRTKKRVKTDTKDENGKITTMDTQDTYDSTDIKKLTIKEKEDPERLQKTIFIGNLPTCVIKKTNNKKLKTYFSKFGQIESIRFRSIPFSEPLPRRVAFINKKLHPDRDVLNAYIVFKEKSSVQSALSMNAQIFMGKHLRVDSVADPQSHDRKRSIFIGNLSFDAEEEMLWNHFENCGEIENVRIVRDSKTNHRSSVELAFKLNDTKIGTRNIRVSRCAKTELIDNKHSSSIRAHGKKKQIDKRSSGIRARGKKKQIDKRSSGIRVHGKKKRHANAIIKS